MVGGLDAVSGPKAAKASNQCASGTASLRPAGSAKTARHRAGKLAWTSWKVQPLRVKVALEGDPGSEGGRGPEVLLSLLPRVLSL